MATLKEEPVTLTTELPGRTSAYRVAEVRPQVNGVLQKRLFVEGADVKEGQQLYQIDPAPYQAALDSALANAAEGAGGGEDGRHHAQAQPGPARQPRRQPAGHRQRQRYL